MIRIIDVLRRRIKTRKQIQIIRILHISERREEHDEEAGEEEDNT